MDKTSQFKEWLKHNGKTPYGEIENWAKENWIKIETLTRKMRRWRADGEVKCYGKNGKPTKACNQTIYFYKFI